MNAEANMTVRRLLSVLVQCANAEEVLSQTHARFATNAIVSFSTLPLRLASWLGFLASGVALAGAVWALSARLF